MTIPEQDDTSFIKPLTPEEYDRLDKIQVKLLKDLQDKQKPTLSRLFPALKGLKREQL
jgi:predicted RecB family nuclease